MYYSRESGDLLFFNNLLTHNNEYPFHGYDFYYSIFDFFFILQQLVSRKYQFLDLMIQPREENELQVVLYGNFTSPALLKILPRSGFHAAFLIPEKQITQTTPAVLLFLHLFWQNK